MESTQSCEQVIASHASNLRFPSCNRIVDGVEVIVEELHAVREMSVGRLQAQLRTRQFLAAASLAGRGIKKAADRVLKTVGCRDSPRRRCGSGNRISLVVKPIEDALGQGRTTGPETSRPTFLVGLTCCCGIGHPLDGIGEARNARLIVAHLSVEMRTSHVDAEDRRLFWI